MRRSCCSTAWAAAARPGEPQLEGLSAAHRVVAWDLPGYGASAPLDGPLTFPALADAVVRLLDVLGSDQAHVVGLSMGGMIAQHAAVHHPDRVRSLALLATSPAFGLDGTRPEAWRAARLAPLDAGREPGDDAVGVDHRDRRARHLGRRGRRAGRGHGAHHRSGLAPCRRLPGHPRPAGPPGPGRRAHARDDRRARPRDPARVRPGPGRRRWRRRRSGSSRAPATSCRPRRRRSSTPRWSTTSSGSSRMAAMAEWRWVRCFADQLRRCGLTDGEVVAVLSESSSRPELVETARLAAEVLGGSGVRPRRAHAGQRPAGGHPLHGRVAGAAGEPGRPRRAGRGRARRRLHRRGAAPRAGARHHPRRRRTRADDLQRAPGDLRAPAVRPDARGTGRTGARPPRGGGDDAGDVGRRHRPDGAAGRRGDRRIDRRDRGRRLHRPLARRAGVGVPGARDGGRAPSCSRPATSTSRSSATSSAR